MSSQIILIGGMSRSGKSTLAKKLVDHLPSCLHLDLDSFTKPKEELPRVRERIDWEKPGTINWERLLQTVQKHLNSKKYIIVEGIFAFCHNELNQIANQTIYLELDRSAFEKRRKLETRWGKEPNWYLDHVWEQHQKWKNPHNLTIDFCNSLDRHLINQVISSII